MLLALYFNFSAHDTCIYSAYLSDDKILSDTSTCLEPCSKFP